MKTSPFAWGLVAVGLGSLLGCGVTLRELQARNPNAKTLKVHCRPWKMADKANILAMRSSGDYLHTDETPSALREFAKDAGVFIVIDTSAPKGNALKMATDYDLVCHEHLPTRSTPLEALREEKPCSMQANAAGKSNYLGTADPQPCNPGAGGPTNGGAGSAPKQAKKVQREVRVCAHPPGSDTNLGRWTSNDSEGNLIINTYEAFVKAVTNAEIVFIFDETAPPETVYWFVDDPAKLRCLKQPPPKPYATVKASGQLDMMAFAGQMAAALDPSTGSGTGKQPSSAGTSKTGTTGTSSTASTATTSTAPKTGSGAPSSTSNPNGQGPGLSLFEQFANGMIVAGSLAQGNTSGSLNQAGGHRNGMPGGQNVGGFSFPLLQAGVATFQILNGVGVSVSPKKFFKSIVDASKKGQRTVIEKADKAALDFADDVIKKHGQYEMAKGLEEMQTIMPYAMGEKFTQALGGKFQAHKIFEKQALEKLTGRKDFEKLPSVILTKEEHQEITNALAQAWKTHGPKKVGDPLTADQLRKIYNEVYKKKYPHWLEIIEKQLR